MLFQVLSFSPQNFQAFQQTPFLHTNNSVFLRATRQTKSVFRRWDKQTHTDSLSDKSVDRMTYFNTLFPPYCQRISMSECVMLLWGRFRKRSSPSSTSLACAEILGFEKNPYQKTSFLVWRIGEWSSVEVIWSRILWKYTNLWLTRWAAQLRILVERMRTLVYPLGRDCAIDGVFKYSFGKMDDSK